MPGKGFSVSSDGDQTTRSRNLPSVSSEKELQPSDGISQNGGIVRQDTMTLQRKVGLVGGIALIVGTMIGSGIFISPKGVLRGSGSVGLSLIVWSICGVIAMFGALVMAELGTIVKSSGAEYAYLKEAFTPLHRTLGPIPAYLVAYVNVVLMKPASVAIILLTFAEYVLDPMYPGCQAPNTAVKCLASMALLTLSFINCGSVHWATRAQIVCFYAKLLAIGLIVVASLFKLFSGSVMITAINCYSVKLANHIQIIFTVAKLIALVIIIIGGIVMLARGYTQNFQDSFKGTESNIGKIAIGFYNGMWAYDGWNNLNYVTEEIINPVRNLPLAIMIGIPLVTVCYILTNISYFTVMTPQQLLDSPAVAVEFLSRLSPWWSWLMPLCVALSTFGAANGELFSSARLCYVAARDGNMVELLSMIHVKRYTPLPSLIFTTIIALIMILPSDIASLIDFFNFTAWIFYGATAAGLLVMRYTHKDVERPYKVPLIIPVIVVIASIYLVIAPIIDNPRMEFLYAAIFTVGGVVFYIPFVYFKKTLPFMGKFNMFFQMLMEVLPPEKEPEY